MSVARPVTRSVVRPVVRSVSGASGFSSMRADLTSTRLVRGVGSVTVPTIGDSDNDRYVLDFENIWRGVLAEEMRVYGARRVHNLIPAAGTGSASLAVAANKTMTLGAGTYIFSMGAGTGTATFSGTGGATGTLTANASSRTCVTKTITAGTLIVTASVASLVDLQVEDATGRSDTTTPSKYISVGVLSSPWHGANVDGVSYKLTTNGNTVTDNVVTEGEGEPIPKSTIKGLLCEGEATELSGRSADIDNWTTSSTAGVSKDAAGLTGAPNEAFTLTDGGAGATRQRAQNTTIINDADTYYSVTRVAYDASPSVYPAIYLRLIDGTSLARSLVFDPSDGSVTNISTDGSVEFIVRVGGFWYVGLSLTNNSSGNTTAQVILQPAYNTDGSATEDVSATGSTVFASCELYKDTWSYSPILSTGGTTKTRNADDGPEQDIANFPSGDFSLEFELTPYFTEDLAANQGIFTVDSSSVTKGIYFDAGAARRITLSDGTNSVSLNSAWTNVGDTMKVKIRAGGGTMRFSVNKTLSAEASYDDDLNASTAAAWLKDISLAAAVKNAQRYSTDLGNNWLEAS